MQYTFAKSASLGQNSPGQRSTQYFETGGHRAIYHDGWVRTAFHGAPWILTGSVGFKDSKWSLYNIEADFSQSNDLSASNPAKLKELLDLFDQEAKKFGVYPLDDRFVERSMAKRPSVVVGRTKFSYASGTVRIPEGSAPPIYQRSHSITAKLNIPEEGAEGVIVACGGSSAGYSLYVKDGKLNYDYNFFGKATFNIQSAKALPAGDIVVEMKYEQQPFKPFEETTGGPVELFVNGKSVGKGEVKGVAPARFSATETMDIGKDLGGTVTAAYREHAPFAFTGKIKNVTVEVSPTQPLKR